MPDTDKKTAEDEWWERVFEEKERHSFEVGCFRECLTFACTCRREAIAIVRLETGVDYATDH